MSLANNRRRRMCLHAASMLCTVAVLLVVAGPVGAHTGGDADVVVTIDDLPPGMEGMTGLVVNRLAPQMVLANPTDNVVQIIGLEGRAFLRIGPDGVEANLSAAEWYTTNDPAGVTQVPDDIGGEDRWGHVTDEPSWGWYDHRLHPGPLRAPQEIVALGQPADYDRWAIPVTIDDEPSMIEGSFRYQPLRGRFITSITDQPMEQGLEIAVLPGLIPGMFVDNSTSEVVTIAGAHGEPFLRLDPSIGTEANVRSPSWLDSARAQDGDSPEGVVQPDAPPEWQVVATVPRFGWIDPRLGFAQREPSDDVIRAAETAQVAEWSIPIQLGEGTAGQVAGIITWEPNPDLQPVASSGSPELWRWSAVGGVVLLVLAGALVTSRQRRRSRPAGGRRRT
ncbi:MAG: hypothetical protein ACR2HR_03595 [Euzebya sp.]